MSTIIAVTLSILVVTFVVLNIIYKHSRAFNNRHQYIERFRKVPSDLDIVNIGSYPSYYDFDWSVAENLSGYNLAMGPEGFRYDSRIFEYYHPHIKKGGIVVVVVVCPLSFGDNDYMRSKGFSDRYVNILPESMVDLSHFRYFIKKYFPLIWDAKSVARSLIKKIIKPVLSYRNRAMDDKDSAARIKENADNLVDGWLHTNPLLKNFKEAEQRIRFEPFFQENIKDLKSIIDSAILYNLKPVIVVPPVSKYLRSYFSEEFVNAFVFDNLRGFYDKCAVFDHHNDCEYEDIDSYTNGLFLNREYAARFTQKVLKELEEASLI